MDDNFYDTIAAGESVMILNARKMDTNEDDSSGFESTVQRTRES